MGVVVHDKGVSRLIPDLKIEKGKWYFGFAKPTFGIRFLEDRPECAIIIARCVAGWSYVENATALLLSSILKINTEPALAMFLAISNSSVQAAVISAAAQTVLSEADFELFGAMMNLVKRIGDERNQLVHGLYGGSMTVEEGILWTEKKNDQAHTATIWASDYKTIKIDYLNEVFVYEPADLETVAQSIEWIFEFLGSFRGYISSERPEFRVLRYPQLCAEPRIAAELEAIRKRREKR